MNTPMVIGGLLGALAATALLTLVFSLPPLRRRALADRVAPFLQDAEMPSKLLQRNISGGSLFTRLGGPLLRDLVGFLDRLLGGQASVRRRLESLNRHATVEQFRIEQVLWGAGAAALGLGLGAVGLLIGKVNLLMVLVFVIGFAIAGVLGRDWWLTQAVAKRDAAVLAEFPVIAEMLALAVTAGEGPIGAIDRITRLAKGPLIEQLAALLAETRSGTPFLEAVTALRDRTDLPPLARFLDGMAVAIERGTPLADVLRAQAADVRALGKRQLMETGGKKEIAMMVPVVFLVLPLTIVLAFYPGLVAITEVAR
ncbi:type II secretion system F family protein [Nakamurella sp. A5-74]|uniref:type II secretion system F family protein n=1 Tax=Nakamurella sp. A5-74 TaxID=3158264 RepID=UPI00336BEA01